MATNRGQQSVRLSSAGDAEPTSEQRRRAVRTVASAAVDAEDCALLLDALGLKPEEGLSDASSSDGDSAPPADGSGRHRAIS
ncbi:MAG: hypothetical protein ACRDQ7_18695 [Haloechinothrix sp.]